MGKVEETKKKKKKGRPSLLDLQKRTIKQQQFITNPNFQNPNSPTRNSTPNPNRRSTHRNSSIDGNSDDEDDRKDKKHKFLFGLPSHYGHERSPANSLSLNTNLGGAELNADGGDHEACNKRRKINAVGDGSGYITSEKEEKIWKATDTSQGSRVESGPTTPLPDKKLLVFILDRLQKKDTYGVFSEPVDPKELPDYHEIVENPMDFGTVRKKLNGGLYLNLEQFEADVLLICSNAMQYNASDTIFFRQARSIQEMAKRDFENLRQESDESEPQPRVVRRGRPPGAKNLKKSEFPSDATGGDNAVSSSNGYNLRKGLAKASHGSRNSEIYNGVYDWENEFPVSVINAVMKYGKRQYAVDENKRDTYRYSVHTSSIFNTLEGETKQLMTVGLHSEHGYARSLARFAGDLGPVVWKVASRKIQSALPSGPKFGPGWVGEMEKPLNNPVTSHPDTNGFMGVPVSNPYLRRGTFSSEEASESKKEGRVLESLSKTHSGISLGSGSEVGNFRKQAWQGFSPPHRPNLFPVIPPDLNLRFQGSSSPSSSGVGIGSPHQPDLALQL